MSSTKMNVLVYSGNGSTVESVRHCLFTLRRLLSPKYAVITVTGEAIIREPWTPSCAMLVMPGGADLPYCRTLNGEGNRRISQFVERGGAYLGFCAGGYYGSKRCEFEVGNNALEVIGARELAFYPGTCRGCAFKGFVYHSEKGARAAETKVSTDALTKGSVPQLLRSYYNGGGVFVDAPKFSDQGVEVLASFTEELHVDPGEGKAAVVFCRVGQGAAILTSTHPEFAASNLEVDPNMPNHQSLIDDLRQDDKQRSDFLKACLLKLGLQVIDEDKGAPSLSRLHLSSAQSSNVINIMNTLEEIVSRECGQPYIKDENDTFRFLKPSAWSHDGAMDEEDSVGKENAQAEVTEEKIVDYDELTKEVVVHEQRYPLNKETPYFNHQAYYANLEEYSSHSAKRGPFFGESLLYGEVVTSTNTLLEKNTQVLRRLPSGFTAVATVQVAGRGRGTNVWVSPAGSLMFSTVVRHPISVTPKVPVVFLQYLAALAIVEGIKSYDTGFQRLPIRLKWPNDIFALDPTDSSKQNYIKIGGILVNSHYSDTEYLSVVGIGLNTSNASPSTSLNALKPPMPFTLEKLLASVLASFGALYSRFVQTGFDEFFEDLYYKHWLHTEQIVTLEAEGGVRARIKGITRDWGLLIAEELGWEDRPTGKLLTLQSDSNSFDFFKGLIKRKA